jgi:anaerobic glycerol-3-phosphate dehydrogenase
VDISKVDISKLKKVATVVRDTGDLINTYGMSIKELHHTEHWLVGVLGSVKSAALIKK